MASYRENLPRTKIVEDDLDDLLKSKLNAAGTSPEASFGISLKASFGAIGDGVANDTAAIALARQYIADTGNPVTVEPGVYLTDPFVMDILPYARQGFFIGSDSKRCVFKRIGTGSFSFIQLGSPVQTSFQANFPMRFIGIDGGAKTNGPAFTGYDLVRAKIYGVSFTGGTVACRLLGGISVSFYGATFEAANRGLEVLNYVKTAGQVSPSGGGWPNIIKVYGGEIVDNSEWGVFFNGGRMLCLDGVEVEGNGTTLNASQGGIYVGPHIGLEVSNTVTFSKGVVIKNCWFEANKGVADIAMDSGINTIEDCLFSSSAGDNQNDILINGGKYRVSRCSTAFAKTINLLETPSVHTGNVIDMCEFFTVSYNATKTTVMSGYAIAINGGSAIAGIGFLCPIERVGQDNTAAVATIAFNPPFKTGTTPRIYTQVLADDGTASHYSVEVYGISNIGFTMRKKKITSGTAIASNYNVMWRAIGEST